MSKAKVREWVAKRVSKNGGTDAVVMALILEVIELRERFEKLEASPAPEPRGFLAKLERKRK